MIVRHGQTDWNVARKIQGSTDIPLNATGLQQAQATRAALREDEFDAIASSPLQRAAVTAETINQEHGKAHHIDQRLAERNFGPVEGWTVEEVNKAFGTFDAMADVESWHAVGERMFDALRDLADQYPNGRVLVVAHGSSIRAVLGAIQGIPPREVKSMLNCSLTEIRHNDDGTWQILSLNDNTHLPEELRS
jgi:broad specificity phosphatase PhoE